MANDAHALSPIPARAASPSDMEFDSIREAFLETARGRWFLDEYTKRNRNADTAMVLEAVARIERSLAAQKEEQQNQASSERAIFEPPAGETRSSALPSTALAEAMAAVQAIVAAARDSASIAMAGAVLEEALAPSRKCARVIREIAWGLRESGADGRICSLLESQVDAINAACDHVLGGGLRDGVLQAFDQAAQQIDGIGTSAGTPMGAPVAMAHPVAATTIVSAEPDAPPEPVMTARLEIASETNVAPAANIEAAFVAPEPVTAAAMPTLGESLIASGIITKPESPRSDPLAPIRRMSQAEKVAFFS